MCMNYYLSIFVSYNLTWLTYNGTISRFRLPVNLQINRNRPKSKELFRLWIDSNGAPRLPRRARAISIGVSRLLFFITGIAEPSGKNNRWLTLFFRKNLCCHGVLQSNRTYTQHHLISHQNYM